MSVQINVAANQAALTASIQAGVQAYNQRFAQNNQLNLTINPRAFSQPLGRITGDVKDFEAALAASNARVIAFGASTAVLGGVIRSFKELANVTIEVEKNLADINRVFGLTTSQLQKFSTDLFNVTKQTASSFNDASQAALEFSRQGLKAEETLQRTKDALTLTRLAGVSTANAVDALTSTVNGFAATGVTTTQILNKLVAVEQDFAVGAGDLAEALSRTGQAAQEAGVSLDQLNALVTSAQQSTARGGAVIGNALKTIFTRLQRTDTLDQLEAFNISVRDVQGNILPAVTILQNFAGAYKNLADAQRAQLSEQVAGVYQVNILKAIVNDLNKSQGVYAGALQRGAMATNEAEVATAKLNQTLDALLKQTATSTQQLANNIGKVTFEPLARYGTEQLKSLVESMNEILEGEGIGSTFANGLLKGIRNILAGPGAIAAFFTLFKLIQNSFTYLTQALPQIAGITTETQNRKNIEQSILQIMAQQGPVAQALAGTMGNQAAQAQLLLQVARQQTAEYQTQTALARQLAAQLAGQGVRVRGSGGLQVTRAGGYIPASTKLAEVVGAQAGGYSPGRVVSSPVGGVMNTAEDVKYIPGFAQPFINPPAGSKAGRKHRQNAISRTGVDPYMAGGFIPNFTLPSIYEKEYGLPLLAGRVFESLLRGDDYISLTEHRILADIDKGPFAAPPKEAKLSGKAAYNDKNLGIGKPKGSELALPLTAIKDYDEKLKDRGINISRVGYTHPELFAKAKEIVNREKGNKNTNISRIKLFDGFIPNFATPMSTASIPWFKKYSSKYKNAAGDTDLFKMGDFPTYGRGLDHEYAKKGNSAMLSYLHEDFVRSALNIALGSKKVIRPAEVGFKNKPVSDIANENDFDLLYRIADGSYSMLELKQDFKNISGSVTGFMNKKLANLEKENPALAKKVSSMIAVSNRPKFTDATGRNAGANFSEFEMAAASIVKDKYSNVDPSISAKLTKVTDGLLRRYEAKKNISSGGFIPNFAKFKSRFGTATLGKTDPIDLEFFGKTLGRKIKPSDIVSIEDLTTKGKGNASNLYGDIANSIKGKGGIFGYALAQNRSVDSSKVKDPLARLKAKYPQIAKRIGLGGETFISGDYGQNIVKASTMQDLVKYQDQILKMVDPAVLTLKSFANGFIPNFASRREMFRDLIKFNLDSAPNNQNILGGKTTLFRGVRNNKNSIFGQSRNYSQTENSRDYFRNTDIDKIANDHISEKKLLPFVSASIDKDIAEHFARGRRDDNLLGSGVVGSKTIKNSRIFSEQSIRKFIDKYGEKALKDIMLELSNWGSLGYGKGMAINFQSFSQKKGFEGTDFAKEISFLSNGFIPNLASGTDIYKGYAFNNTGKIYNDLYHSDAWDSIEGSTAGAIKYAYHNNKLLLQTNKAISPILKKAFLSRGVPESAFSPVEDVDSMMRSKNKQEIDDKLKNLGSVQLSSGIQAILEKGYYRKLIKGQQFYNIPGGVSPEELKIFGGVDGWVKYQEQNYGPLKWGSYASGFIPNLANFIDVDTLGKNSVHYSGDLMKLIKDIEASIGRNLSSGELRFLTNPKTNLSKLNDPKVLNKFINSERKGGFAGFANGFVPNFAYKQAVMGLEEKMSGNKAILDTSTGPFPFIRNTGQANFADAIADHGGLNNALSDSMRGQKAAGLMSKGFVPNFAKQPNNGSFDIVRFSNSIATSVDNFGKQLSNKIGFIKDSILLALDNMNKNFDPQKIQRTAESTAQRIVSSISNAGNIFNKNINNPSNQPSANSPKLTAAQMAASFGNMPTRNPMLEKFSEGLSKASTAISIAGPLLAGFIEQATFGNKQRSEMTSGERFGQSVLSTGLSAISTGAGIGASFGLPGAVVGGLGGTLIALTSAFKATTLTVEELRDVADKYKTETQQSVSAAQSYIDTLKTLQTSTDPEVIKKASTSLEQYFKNIEDVQLQNNFKEAGDNVDKLAKSLSDYEKRRGVEQSRKEELAKSASYTGANFKALTKAGYSAMSFGSKAYLDIYGKPKELAQEAINDFNTFFTDLQKSMLDKSGIEDLQKLVMEERNRSNILGITAFDQDKIRSFLQSKNVSADISVSLSEMFDNLENQGNEVGRYIINNLVGLFEQSKNQLKQEETKKIEKETARNGFLNFRRTLLEKINDEFNSADAAIKSFESQSSLSQLLPAKLKEINDLIYNSIVNNLSSAKGLSFKEAQTKNTGALQAQEFTRQQFRAIQESSLKSNQLQSQFNQQISDIIFNAPVQTGVETQTEISRFLQGGTNRTRGELKTFAGNIVGKNVNDIDKLVNSLENAQNNFRNTTRTIESETKFKLQEIAYNKVINELTIATSTKQIELEREKLKITLSQRDTVNDLRSAIDQAKIAANERLELTKIQTGGEFRYLGLNKRQEFESKQVDMKAIFDQEQAIAENQAIADARRSAIEIAAQDANTKAQNDNTNAIFDLIDSLSTSISFEGFKQLQGGGNVDIGLGKIAASNDMRNRNRIAREQFKQSRETLALTKISDYGITDNASIDTAITELKKKLSDITLSEETKLSIKETITTLEIASKQIGSNSTIFAARAAQARSDFEKSTGFVNNMKIGFQELPKKSDELVDQLGRNLPAMFGDGLVDGIKAAIRESDNLGDALMGIASKFLDEISTTLMRSAIYGMLGSIGVPNLSGMGGKQKGGIIRAQSGMYISGTGSGDKYPALLENGEYVLNRRAVMAMGGPASLDQLNFAMAPRFASGGSFGNEFTDLKSMESNMTSYGMENSKLYNELRDAEVSAAEERRRKAFARKQQRAALIGSVVAAVASIGLAQGMSNFSQNAQAKKAQTLSGKLTSGAALTKAESASIKPLMDKGFINSYGQYAGPQPQTGFRSFISKPFYSSSIYGANPYAPAFASDRKQSGGLIGSRLSDTIPGYMEGGLYNTPIVKRYGVGMQFGGASPISNSNSNVVNTTNATNSFNFNTNVSRDGTIEVGSNSTSYAQQDVALSKNLNSKVYAVVLDAIKNEQRFGGSLAGTRQG